MLKGINTLLYRSIEYFFERLYFSYFRGTYKLDLDAPIPGVP